MRSRNFNNKVIIGIRNLFRVSTLCIGLVSLVDRGYLHAFIMSIFVSTYFECKAVLVKEMEKDNTSILGKMDKVYRTSLQAVEGINRDGCSHIIWKDGSEGALVVKGESFYIINDFNNMKGLYMYSLGDLELIVSKVLESGKMYPNGVISKINVECLRDAIKI